MRIDAHNHFWQYDPVEYAWIDHHMTAIQHDFLPARFKDVLDANHVDGTVAVQARQTLEETNFLLQLAADHAWIKGVVGWIDLQAEDIEIKLEHYAGFDILKGFRHIAQSEARDFLISGNFLRGIQALSATHFTYDILIFPPQLPAAAALVRKFPHQKFVLDHIAKPFVKTGEVEPWKQHIHTLAQSQNVYCKLSGMVTEARWDGWQLSDLSPYIDVVVEEFGTRRLMFGSDYPVCLLAASYGEVVQVIEDYFVGFSESERADIFYNNVSTFYNL
jgi:L-fuconolactonase